MRTASFYILENPQLRQVEIACRLCVQLSKKYRIWCYCADEKLCNTLDEALWQGQAETFVAHGINHIHDKICLSVDGPKAPFDLCINLSGQALDIGTLPEQVLHIVELVGHNEEDKQHSRHIYKIYQNAGLKLKMHHLS